MRELADTDPRSQWYDTIIDAAGNALMEPDPEIDVFLRGTTTRVNVFAYSSGLTIKTNPFPAIEGWADCWLPPGAYDIVIRDTAVPPRRGQRIIGFDSVPAAPSAIPGSWIMADGGVRYDSLDDESKRQDVPIGGMVAWWRPNNGVGLPSGFLECNGQAVAAGDHEFPGVGSFNVPDMRNQFLLGASSAVADNSAGSNSNGPGGAPGINGSGGTNGPFNLQHSHTYVHSHTVAGVDHLHHVTIPDHLHSWGSLYAGDHNHAMSFATSAPVNGIGTRSTGGFSTVTEGHQHAVNGTTFLSGALGIGGYTGAADRGLSAWSGAADRTLNTSTTSQSASTTSNGLNTNHDLRPSYRGAIWLMKVRRA